MAPEIEKQIAERAIAYCKEFGRTGEINGFDVSAYTHGAIDQFEIDGGDMILKEMRQIILSQCHEWLKHNAQPKYIYIEDGQPWIDNARLLHDFMEEMNNLWSNSK